jgi:hypothetical protein
MDGSTPRMNSPYGNTSPNGTGNLVGINGIPAALLLTGLAELGRLTAIARIDRLARQDKSEDRSNG